MSIFVASLDLGQAQDYSALIILEAFGRKAVLSLETPEPLTGLMMPISRPVEVLPVERMDIRHIERFPLGTKYGEIVRQVEQRLIKVPQPYYLVVDETGVGISVVEQLGRLRPHGITITAGNDATLVAPQKYRVPKRDLIAPLQVRLQEGTLRIGKGLPHVDLLVKEILAFRVKISAAGRDTYEAWREADHDDLVLAAGMGCWFAEEAFRWITRGIREMVADNLMAAQGEYQISPI